MTDKIQEKVNNTVRFALQAFQHYKNEILEDTLTNGRKSCEAICRAIFLDKMGDINGEKLILGEIDENLVAKQRRRGQFEPPSLANLLSMIDRKGHITKPLYFRFQDVRFGGNNASHDPIMENSHVTLDSVQLCIAQLKVILKWFWRDFLRQPLPLLRKSTQQRVGLETNSC